MHGTVPQKIGRVIGNLLLHPQYISRCVSHNLVNGKTPLDLELPWFSYAAIDFLKAFLEPHMTSGILLYAFAAALIGGIDSPGGAVLGGFIVGILENVVGAYIGTELKLSVALGLIIAVLVIKPSGLFGKVWVTRV